MYRILQGETHNLPDVSNFIETLNNTRELFIADSLIYVARAPGRLDVMGGIADYSGSLVLEMPIAEAVLAALQKIATRTIKIVSLGADEVHRTNSFEMPLADLELNGMPISYGEAQVKFKQTPSTSWAAYIAGAFLVLMREKALRFDQGAIVLIDSRVPEGKGVSSSAAIEVAAMSAITAAFEIALEPRELALLCQKVENLVVGAPCGIMDQMSSACGDEDKLLSMICQPAELRGTVSIADDIAFWGIDSGIRHSVGGGDYGSVRTGAFMGYRIIAELEKMKIERMEIDGVVRIADTKFGGYLANVTPDEFEMNYGPHLPKTITGEEFLTRYQGITDTVTHVAPGKTYAVFYPTKHPVYENFRVNKFSELLAKRLTEENLNELGQLMYASHKSYSACGLGTPGTDLLVEMAKRSKGLYGAKITGGGSGGTVAVLGRKDASGEIEAVAREYEKIRGYRPYIFSGSSLGAAAFGHLELTK